MDLPEDAADDDWAASFGLSEDLFEEVFALFGGTKPLATRCVDMRSIACCLLRLMLTNHCLLLAKQSGPSQGALLSQELPESACDAPALAPQRWPGH